MRGSVFVVGEKLATNTLLGPEATLGLVPGAVPPPGGAVSENWSGGCELSRCAAASGGVFLCNILWFLLCFVSVWRAHGGIESREATGGCDMPGRAVNRAWIRGFPESKNLKARVMSATRI